MMPVPAFIISLFFGNYPISPGDVLQTLMTFPPPDEGIISTAQVLFGIRIPRILLAMVIGAALSVSGACFQGIFRNPLVSRIY
jgi:iron complex transport system permease protein